jgi:hypothetical protein
MILSLSILEKIPVKGNADRGCFKRVSVIEGRFYQEMAIVYFIYQSSVLNEEHEVGRF